MFSSQVLAQLALSGFTPAFPAPQDKLEPEKWKGMNGGRALPISESRHGDNPESVDNGTKLTAIRTDRGMDLLAAVHEKHGNTESYADAPRLTIKLNDGNLEAGIPTLTKSTLHPYNQTRATLIHSHFLGARVDLRGFQPRKGHIVELSGGGDTVLFDKIQKM